ncbi:terminase large subunit [Catenovulum sediminis]|uniref:Terminase TerL endonuclease subunit n=1 Tax=Catenovulum sediminis TaxID=1740262 RepID=A0ABV1RKV2_9ALTE
MDLIDNIESALEKNATVDDGIQYAMDAAKPDSNQCVYVRQAAQRFLNDLHHGQERGLAFSRQHAEKILTYFPFFCVHVEGELSGQPIYLEPWQSFVLINVFGWYRFDDELDRWVRRFDKLYLEVPRKNAKSMLLSGIGTYMTAFDGEGGAQVYSAATKKDQAKIVFDAAAEMVKKSPALKKIFSVQKIELTVESSFSRFRPLARDADSLDGLNSHCNIVDELHAHKTRELWDVLINGTAARTQPLTAAITTAGTNREGICYQQREYVASILKGKIEDDSYFGVIYTIDDNDDPYDESNWFKANPNLGKSKKLKTMRSEAKQAQISGEAKINFLIKHLDYWTDAAVEWIDSIKWQNCAQEFPENVHELPCWVGVDYAPMHDVTAVILLYSDQSSGKFYVKSEFYYATNSIDELPEAIQTKFKRWEHSGHLKTVAGSMMDLDTVEARILELKTHPNVKEINLDPWNTYQLTARLDDKGLDAVHVPQTVKNFSESMKFTEALVFEQKLIHDNNPMMNWMIGNLQVKPDLNGNVFPRKADNKSENKIDGPVGLFTAMNRAMINATEFNPLDHIDDISDLL